MVAGSCDKGLKQTVWEMGQEAEGCWLVLVMLLSYRECIGGAMCWVSVQLQQNDRRCSCCWWQKIAKRCSREQAEWVNGSVMHKSWLQRSWSWIGCHCKGCTQVLHWFWPRRLWSCDAVCCWLLQRAAAGNETSRYQEKQQLFMMLVYEEMLVSWMVQCRRRNRCVLLLAWRKDSEYWWLRSCRWYNGTESMMQLTVVWVQVGSRMRLNW